MKDNAKLIKPINFFTFLIKYKVKQLFIKYFEESHNNLYTLEKHLKTTSSFNWIMYAFDWEADTDEGDKFWNDLHTKWNIYIDKYKTTELNKNIKIL